MCVPLRTQNEDIDQFDYNLSESQLKTLVSPTLFSVLVHQVKPMLVQAEWIMYYEARYKIVGFLVDHKHPYNVTDLPVIKPKRMLGMWEDANVRAHCCVCLARALHVLYARLYLHVTWLGSWLAHPRIHSFIHEFIYAYIHSCIHF